MASMCERNEELSSEEKASLDDIMKQAVCYSESQELLNESLGVVSENEGIDKALIPSLKPVVLGGVLNNQTKGPLSVMASHKFAGHIVKGFPGSLKVASTDVFSMSALQAKGVKAAVVYSGKNKDGIECGWLLAFAHTKATGRRIYAECGRKDKFSKINWAQVEQKLDNAGITVESAHDKETGTSLYATIVGSGNTAAVGALYRG